VDDSLFNYSIKLKPSYIEKEDFTLLQKLADEKELVGVYLSAHPLSDYRKGLTKSGFISLNKIQTEKINTTHKIEEVVQEVRKIRKKRGNSMQFITVSEESNKMEAVLFLEVYRI